MCESVNCACRISFIVNTQSYDIFNMNIIKIYLYVVFFSVDM